MPQTLPTQMVKIRKRYSKSTPWVISRHPTPFGTIGKLPFEIRQIIYRHYFTAAAFTYGDNTGLNRASKALHAETEKSLGQYAICKTEIIWHNDYGYYRSDIGWTFSALPAKVQNLQITVRVVDNLVRIVGGDFDRLQGIVRRLVDEIQKPKYCCLKFKLGGFTPLHASTFSALKPLRRFEDLVVKLHYGAMLGREFALKENEEYAEMRKALVDDFNDALGPQVEGDVGGNLTISEEVEYRDDDGWYRVLKDNEEDEYRKYQARKQPKSNSKLARQTSEDFGGIQRWQMHRKLQASRIHGAFTRDESSNVDSEEDSERDSSETSSLVSSVEVNMEPGQTSILDWLKG